MKYEVHLTFGEIDNFDRFKTICYREGLTIIDIQTETYKGDTGHQLMTKSLVGPRQYRNYIKEMQKVFKYFGFKMIRAKVERYPKAYKSDNLLYYETHFKLELPKDFDRSKLIPLCEKYNFHISRNLYKSFKTVDHLFLTHRTSTTTYRFFKINCDLMKRQLEKVDGVKLIKEEYEECIYDSNISLDKSWLYGK